MSAAAARKSSQQTRVSSLGGTDAARLGCPIEMALRQNLADDFSVDVGQPIVAALKMIGEPGVFHAK
jgi:hypothetical protein